MNKYKIIFLLKLEFKKIYLIWIKQNLISIIIVYKIFKGKIIYLIIKMKNYFLIVIILKSKSINYSDLSMRSKLPILKRIGILY